jgi:hypothetical protein
MTTGWEHLPQGKLSLRDDSIQIINHLLDLHNSFLLKFEKNGSLESNGKLFWVTIALLNFSPIDFTETVSKALDNIIYILDHLDRTKLDNYFLYPLDTKEGRSCDIQSLLIPHVFCKDAQIQDKAVKVLLNSWVVFPAVTVDANKSALLYTILYVTTWIFVRIRQNRVNDNVVQSFEKLEQFLLIYYPTEIEDLQRGINRLKEIITNNPNVPLEAQLILFKQCMTSVFAHFISEFGNNIAQYVGQIIFLDGAYHSLGLSMCDILWKTASELQMDLNKLHQIKVLLKGIPFVKENSHEKDQLILMIFKQSGEQKDVDVASQGRFEALPPFECSTGSVRAAWNWIHNDLGISPSNKMYGLM